MGALKRWASRVPGWVWPAALVAAAWLLPVRHILSGVLAIVALTFGAMVVGFLLWVLAGLAMPDPGVRLDGPAAILAHARSTVSQRVRTVRLALGQAPWRRPQRVVSRTAARLIGETADLPTGRAAFPAFEVRMNPRTVESLDAWMPIEDVAWHWARAYGHGHEDTPRVVDRVTVVIARDPAVPVNRAAVRPGFRVSSHPAAVAVASAPLTGPPVADTAERGEAERLSPPAQEDVAVGTDIDHTVRLPAAGPRPESATARLEDTTVRLAGSVPTPRAGLALVPVDPVTGQEVGEALRVDAPGGTIGRAPGADIRLDDPHLSRDHAELRRDEAGWAITDRHSTGGTRVNGTVVPPGVPQPLREGDVIEFGSPGGSRPRLTFKVGPALS